MASQNDLLDFSYRKVEMVPWSKIPPKLKSDRPDFRPHNKNYVEYLSHLEKHKLRRGQRVSQSLGVTTYVKDAQKEVWEEYQEQVHIPRYLQVSSKGEESDAFNTKRRLLMSKYCHDQFEPAFETEFAKAYYEGVEDADTAPGETITQLIMRLGRYKGKIKPQVGD